MTDDYLKLERELASELHWFSSLVANVPTIRRALRLAAVVEEACGFDLHPQEQQMCGPLSWLKSAIDDLAQRGPAPGTDDPDAYVTMIGEVRSLHEKLAALARIKEARERERGFM